MVGESTQRVNRAPMGQGESLGRILNLVMNPPRKVVFVLLAILLGVTKMGEAHVPLVMRTQGRRHRWKCALIMLVTRG